MDLLTVTPRCWTTSGSEARASWSLFCTFAQAMSGSVPGANVSVIWAVPDESPVEYMYSIRSIPVIVVSIGWITLLSTVAADAPG